ncbi:hypothetical protein Q5752_001318 [Cryptotrichosporon argae]
MTLPPPPHPPPALAPLPSPARSNPFARPAGPASASFSRTSLLPSPSPAKASASASASAVASAQGTPGSAKRRGWRLLWRGGLEVGQDGWRLDGITFFALLDFASTPLAGPSVNPFDTAASTSTSTLTSTASTAAAASFPSDADTDLCLSLESLRGRKWLSVRGVVEIDDAALADDGGVHIAISPHAPLLSAYFTHQLCRHAPLTAHGRTAKAILIGLSDEGLDGAGNSLLIYGQRSADTTLRLCVGRRRPPPAAKIKVRPGEPLPRAPLFFPSHAPSKPPPPIPRRHLAPARSFSRSFSRNPSASSIYAPPAPAPAPAPPVALAARPPAPVSGRTPGRRGEKRPRKVGEGERDERRRGRVVLERRNTGSSVGAGSDAAATDSAEPVARVGHAQAKARAKDGAGNEDIFGKRPLPPEQEPASGARAKRARVPQQVLDNKAVVRKQTAVALEVRGLGRGDGAFKDVFGMTTKGVYFAFRNRIEVGPLDRERVRDVISLHLDMYLVAHEAADMDADEIVKDEREGTADVLWGIKEETDVGTDGVEGVDGSEDAFEDVKEERMGTEVLLAQIKEEDAAADDARAAGIGIQSAPKEND